MLDVLLLLFSHSTTIDYLCHTSEQSHWAESTTGGWKVDGGLSREPASPFRRLKESLSESFWRNKEFIGVKDELLQVSSLFSSSKAFWRFNFKNEITF